MDLFAAHVSYVIASYAISGVCIFGLFAYVLIRDQRLAATLKNHKDPE